MELFDVHALAYVLHSLKQAESSEIREEIDGKPIAINIMLR